MFSFHRGKCSFKSIFNLKDGLKFLDAYKNKSDFMKAAKEMAFTIQQKTSQKINKSFCDILKDYVELTDNQM